MCMPAQRRRTFVDLSICNLPPIAIHHFAFGLFCIQNCCFVLLLCSSFLAKNTIQSIVLKCVKIAQEEKEICFEFCSCFVFLFFFLLFRIQIYNICFFFFFWHSFKCRILEKNVIFVRENFIEKGGNLYVGNTSKLKLKFSLESRGSRYF